MLTVQLNTHCGVYSLVNTLNKNMIKIVRTYKYLPKSWKVERIFGKKQRGRKGEKNFKGLRSKKKRDICVVSGEFCEWVIRKNKYSHR